MKNQKIIFALIGVVVLLATAIGAFLLFTQGTNFLPFAGAETTISLSPTTGSIQVGKNTQLAVVLNTSKKIKETNIIIAFDNTAIAVTGSPVIDKRLGPVKKRTNAQQANKTGKIIIATKANKALSGTGTLFSFKVRGKALQNNISISIDPASKILDDKGNNILTGANIINGTYNVLAKVTGNDPVCDELIASPSAGVSPLTVTATINARQAKQPITKYVFNFTGTDETQSTPVATHIFTTAGTFQITGKVIDKAGNSSDTCSDSTDVTSSSGDNGSGGGNTASGSGEKASGCPSINNPACYDCNGDGAINILDYSCFNNIYGKQKDSGGNWK